MNALWGRHFQLDDSLEAYLLYFISGSSNQLNSPPGVRINSPLETGSMTFLIAFWWVTRLAASFLITRGIPCRQLLYYRTGSDIGRQAPELSIGFLSL